jgi:N-acetylmuramoyl-L-alanine amidase
MEAVLAYTVIIDAGHGGSDYGATYQGRREKDDTLRLALAVGEALELRCVNVEYTRTTDIYNTPFEKATIGNNSDADLFLSIHRNAVPVPNTATGIETLVYDDNGLKARLARNINEQLRLLGFTNRGVIERPNLVVLRRTRIPAVLVEVGFIDNEDDNEFFDENFQAIADAIANGVIDTIGVQCDNNQRLYRVQVGAFRIRENADRLLNELKSRGYQAFIVMEDGLYKVQVGAFSVLDNAVKLETRLKRQGYDTFIAT